MIGYLDALIRDLLVGGIDEIGDEMQVRFPPPDDEWITYVNGLTSNGQPVNALNVYLIDVRENRKLRSNQVTRAVGDGFVAESFAPMRLDCHYLITAWSPADVSPAIEPAMDEHKLLYEVAAVLANHQPLVPSNVYTGGLPLGFPEAIADAALPIEFVPVEGFSKYAEFWGTMGASKPWRPAIQLVVTLPILYEPGDPVPFVTTQLSNYRIGENDAGTQMRIGGYVLDAISPGADGAPVPVQGAWVELEALTGERLQLTRTNGSGQFEFGELRPAGSVDGTPHTYRLRAHSIGYPETTRELQFPSPSGVYDLLFE